MYSTANLQKSSRYDQIKRLAETNIKQTQNYKSAEKFVNIPSTIHKKVSGNTENGRKVTFLRVAPESIIHRNKKRLLLLQRAFC